MLPLFIGEEMKVIVVREGYERIQQQLAKNKKMTANECIDAIFKDDLTAGYVNSVDRGWRYYLHLNKLFSPMSKVGLIKHIDHKMGPSRKKEKVWSLL